MSSYYPAKRRPPESVTTEFDVLKASHKFLRDREEDAAKTWDAQLAKKYEDSLFKEFAVCDLKHYKSGNIALRWRTEDEVLSGAGEETCGNTRCPYHDSQSNAAASHAQETRSRPPKPPRLTTMELPFSYVERGETEVRQVMVKVVLCERCVKKLMWKHEKEKKERLEATGSTSTSRAAEKPHNTGPSATDISNRRHEDKSREHVRNGRRSGNHSRSRSPKRRHREP